MRTAEEILKETITKYNNTVQPLHKFQFSKRETTLFSEMLNEARKEAIEECSINANLKVQYGYGTIDNIGTTDFTVKDKTERTTYGHGDSSYEIVTVNKQSILSLIKELK